MIYTIGLSKVVCPSCGQESICFTGITGDEKFFCANYITVKKYDGDRLISSSTQRCEYTDYWRELVLKNCTIGIRNFTPEDLLKLVNQTEILIATR